MTETRGRKSLDGAPRTVKVMVRMTAKDKALLDALRGATSANQFILDAIRVRLRDEVK
tara:strand:- start:1120 stop:1293 length:174 start_codon:yes stop_codon:yes gene_type:complete